MTSRPLKNITREDLEPLWSRLDIPTEKVAEALGVTRQGLSHKARALGLPSRVRNRRKLCDDATFERMWLAGVSIQEIADHFGYMQRQGVTTRRRHLGLPPRTRIKGTKQTGGWRETISMTRYVEIELSKMMGVSA